MLVVRYATGLGDHVVVAPATFSDSTCPHDIDMMLTVSTFLSWAVSDKSLMHIRYVALYFLYNFFALAWNPMRHVHKRALHIQLVKF